MGTPLPISYTDMVSMADDVLGVHAEIRQLFFETIEDTDAAVLEQMMKKTSPADG